MNTTDTRKPFYASLGAGDLAVEKLRGLNDDYVGLVRKWQSLVSELPTQVAKVRSLDAKGLAETVEVRTGTAIGRAFVAYDQLAQRGEKLAGSIRRQPSTKRAGEQAQATKRAAKGTATSARRSAAAAEKAVADAAAKIG